MPTCPAAHVPFSPLQRQRMDGAVGERPSLGGPLPLLPLLPLPVLPVLPLLPLLLLLPELLLLVVVVPPPPVSLALLGTLIRARAHAEEEGPPPERDAKLARTATPSAEGTPHGTPHGTPPVDAVWGGPSTWTSPATPSAKGAAYGAVVGSGRAFPGPSVA